MTLVHRTLNLGPMDNNTYVIACPETREAAVVDVGFEPEAVVDEVRRLGLTVTLLLNTHAHYDHIAGMREVQRALGGVYWVHPADRAMLDVFNAQGAAFGFPPAALPDDPHDLADGQRLAIGRGALAVLHTPGHSPGHVSFVAGDDVWSGDVLFAGSVGRTDLAGGSWPELERSARERLFPLGDAVRVHPGHGPATTIGHERLTNPFVGEESRFA
jgi:glyoxylase-like metal-dependent hydrolase (beta-lactamase superfamily II)